jgi:Mlc titration factor MtfA (ptsG expression regulator)
LMMDHAPDLYRVLREYYRQDPIHRIGRNSCAV